MKKILAFVLGAFISIASMVGTRAQVGEKENLYAEIDSAPIVPIDVLKKGRKATTFFLMDNYQYVQIKFGGRSLVGGYPRFFFVNELIQQGLMKHRGSFTELSSALATIPFDGEVLKTPEGYYDLNCEVTLHMDNGRVAMKGYGYLNIQEGKGGELVADKFRPNVTINRNISFRVGSDVTAAKTLNSYTSGVVDKDLPVRWYGDENDGQLVTVPTSALGDSQLIVSTWQGEMFGWDLKTGQSLSGEKVIGLLGEITSADIVSVGGLDGILNQAIERSFYRSNGRIYGNFPGLELVTPFSVKTFLTPEQLAVDIWGSEQAAVPSRIFVKPIWLDSGDKASERELPFSEKLGGWIFEIPAGGHQIRIEFDEVYHYDADPNPKG